MPPLVRHAALLAALALLAGTARAAPGEGEEAPAAAPPPAHGPQVVAFRFAWPAPLEARVSYRRTTGRTGEAPSVFNARWEQRAEQDGGAWRISTRGTRWDGDLPFPPELLEEALRASEQVIQRVGPEGEFQGLENAEALRPVLAQLLERTSVPADQAGRALAMAEAAARAEAEELWNLAVGFWVGAELELGEPYVMQGEAEPRRLPGARPRAVEFRVRRRVPCSAGERTARCVEVILRSTPERAGAARRPEAERGGPEAVAAAGAADRAAESELVLVTEPATLVPRRLVWTRTVRLGAGEPDAPPVEQVDRREYDYRYPAPAPAEPPRKRKKRPAAPRAVPHASAGGEQEGHHGGDPGGEQGRADEVHLRRLAAGVAPGAQ